MSERTELVGRVAAGLAHDLNGPIGVVLGFTQLAKEKLEGLSIDASAGDAEATASVLEYLKMIESAGENARSLARDMWDFSKAVTGEKAEYDFTELLETSARLVAPSLRVAAIEPPASGELQSEIVTGDRAMWAQALVGLMIDAPTALPGGGSVSWKMERATDGKYLNVVLTASPNDPEMSATTPVPAQNWACRDSSISIISELGGTLGPLSGRDGEQSGIEISVPVYAS